MSAVRFVPLIYKFGWFTFRSQTPSAPGLRPSASEQMGGKINWVKSVCRYCGTGCGLYIGVENGKVMAVKGDTDNRKNGKLERATWDEAMSLVASKFRDTIAKYGPDSVGFYGSGQALTEESYCANKLFKAGIRTNNLEGNPRLCMASAVAGYLTTYGKDEPMGCYEDIDHADVFFIIGSNTAEAHPILFERIVKRQSANPAVKVIVLDPRRTPTSRIANLHISFTPGTDMAILNAMANVLITEKLIDEDFLKTHVAFGEGAEANKTGTITRHSLRNTRRTRQPKSQAAELKTLCGPRTGSATKKPPLCPCGPWA
ncbi:MAG: molybdopterin-dependent oxidoreductase [Candidatus Korobacteraceae bacterium]